MAPTTADIRILGPSIFHRTFDKTADFAAVTAAEAWLKARGFSVGRRQAHSPSGILFGDFDIQKWRNLSLDDRRALHGKMSGDFCNGPVTVDIFASAPAEAIAACTSSPRDPALRSGLVRNVAEAIAADDAIRASLKHGWPADLRRAAI